MNHLELKPTLENITHSYINNTIGRKLDVDHFVNLLSSIDNNTVISLDGAWGSGKTFFIHQVKLLLDAHNDFKRESQTDFHEKIKKCWSQTVQDVEMPAFVTVYYDAWQHDNDEDPLVSLIYEMIKETNEEIRFKNGQQQKIIDGVLSVIDGISGKSIANIKNSFAQENPFASFEQNRRIDEEITELIDNLLQEHGDRLVIFIDELDRCKPTFAVQMLEKIKHYFDDERITIVYATAIGQLQHTIKKYYGNDFDASRYFDRFFDLRITLPQPDWSRYHESIHFGSLYNYDRIGKAVMEHLGFELRERSRYVNCLNIAAAKAMRENGKFDFYFSDGQGREFILMCIVPIAIGLKMCSEEEFQKFITGKKSDLMVEILSQNRDFVSICARYLIASNERDENEHKLVMNKLNEAYAAICKPGITAGNMGEVRIGECLFTAESKGFLIRAISLLSNYSDYS